MKELSSNGKSWKYSNIFCIFCSTVVPFLIGLILNFLYISALKRAVSRGERIQILPIYQFFFLLFYSIFFGYHFYDKKKFLVIFPFVSVYCHLNLSILFLMIFIFKDQYSFIEFLLYMLNFYIIFVIIPPLPEYMGYNKARNRRQLEL